MKRTDLTGLEDVQLYDAYLWCKEEIERRTERRKTCLGLIKNNMLITEVKKELGMTFYTKFLQEGAIYEIEGRVRLL